MKKRVKALVQTMAIMHHMTAVPWQHETSRKCTGKVITITIIIPRMCVCVCVCADEDCAKGGGSSRSINYQYSTQAGS